MMFNPFSKSKKSDKKKPAKGPAKSNGRSAPAKLVKAKGKAKESRPAKPAAETAERVDARGSLDKAKQALDSGEAKKRSSLAEREKLIKQALAVHKTQSKLLDDLDEETRDRLRTLALEKLVLGRFKSEE